jgi:hypothetical protein
MSPCTHDTRLDRVLRLREGCCSLLGNGLRPGDAPDQEGQAVVLRAEEGAEKATFFKMPLKVDTLAGPTNDLHDFLECLISPKLQSKQVAFQTDDFFSILFRRTSAWTARRARYTRSARRRRTCRRCTCCLPPPQHASLSAASPLCRLDWAQALGPVLQQIGEMTLKIKQHDWQIQQLGQAEYPS